MLGRGATEEHHLLRRDKLYLPLEKGPASLSLLWRRRAVSRRSPVDDVGDVHIRFAEADRRQHLIEQLPRPADERLAFEVLLASRRLADQHHAGFRRTTVKAQILGRRLESAAVEGGKPGFQLIER